MRHHKVVEADHEPDLPPGARTAPGQHRAAPQGGHQPTPCAIPAFHQGRLDRRAELSLAPRLAQTAWATADHAPADLHDMASRVADFHHLGVKQAVRCHESGLQLAAHFPPPPAPIHHPQHLEQHGGIGLPPIREQERDRSGARHNLCEQCRGGVLGTRPEVDPQEKLTPHGQRGLHPCHLFGTPLLRLIPLPPLDLQVLHTLPMVGLSSMGSPRWKRWTGLRSTAQMSAVPSSQTPHR